MLRGNLADLDAEEVLLDLLSCAEPRHARVSLGLPAWVGHSQDAVAWREKLKDVSLLGGGFAIDRASVFVHMLDHKANLSSLGRSCLHVPAQVAT